MPLMFWIGVAAYWRALNEQIVEATLCFLDREERTLPIDGKE